MLSVYYKIIKIFWAAGLFKRVSGNSQSILLVTHRKVLDMKRTTLPLLIASAAAACLAVQTDARDQANKAIEPASGAKKWLRVYPKPKKDQVRYVIWLPHKTRAKSETWRVELITGKTVQADTANHYRLGGGVLTSHIIKGYGFDYLTVSDFGGLASTLKGGGEPIEKYVRAQTKTMGYNSRLPIVVLGPPDLELRYRIWRVDGQTLNAQKQ